MTNGNNFNSPPSPIRILITPLDWGLGHATRCIPIIKYLILLQVEVTIAAAGKSFYLLKKEFPHLRILLINGYKIRYSRKKRNLPFVLLLQSPKLLVAVFKENHWLKKFIQKNQIDAVISDNRFGMYNKKIVSIYVTHQLCIKTGNQLTQRLAQWLNYFFIKKFNTCWVPDYFEKGLAGDLSHPKKVPGSIKYIGVLSRFEKIPGLAKAYDVIIIISGPEPQREIFEKNIISQLSAINKKILLIRGLPDETGNLQTGSAMIEVQNHLSTEEMSDAIQQSRIIICRSGYSTIMDLVKLGRSAIIVPTPGQTEQEYLGQYLAKKGYFYCLAQNEFEITEALNNIPNFEFTESHFSTDQYKKTVDELLQSLKSGKFAVQ